MSGDQHSHRRPSVDALRRHRRRQRSVVRRRAAQDHRADRAERRRQDHRVQLHHRLLQAERRRDAAARTTTAGEIQLERLNDFRISKQAKVARTFQNIRLFPGMTALENLMVAQHNALMLASGLTFLGLIGAPSWRTAEKRAIDLATLWLERIGLHRPRRRRRRQSALWRPAPARNRARDVHRTRAAVPRRAGRRPERARKRRLERIAALDPRRPRHLDPADRARHVGGDGNLRPCRGDGLRREDSPKARRSGSATIPR